jgi:methanogenic corrinoid protein MtbC1
MQAGDGTDFAAPRVPDHGLSIREVSVLLDIPSPTIRSWERRYGIPAPTRSSGGHRRYTPDDVMILRLMRDEVARGQRPVDAAAWTKTQGEAPLPHQPIVDELLASTRELGGRTFMAILDEAVARHGLAETLCTVLIPTMRHVGVWWQTGRCDIAHEHLASESALTWLHRLPCQAYPSSEPGISVLACGPSDHHSIGLEVLAALLRERGRDARMLGPRVPPSALVTAIRTVHASATVVVSHLPSARRDALKSLAAASTVPPALFYAGNAFTRRTARQRVPGTYLGEDLAQATETVIASLSPHAGN